MMADLLNHDDYTIAWIAVLPIEAEAALGMLDKQHQGHFGLVRGDDYIYVGGEINGHNVVVATWPAGQNYGVGAAAALVNQVKARFANLWFALLVGVAAGLPNLTPRDQSQYRDVRLGDVLVCVPDKASSGIVHYDLGKDTDAGFLMNGRQAETPAIVRSAISNIQLTKKKPYKKGNEFARYLDSFLQADEDNEFQRPSQDTDQLFPTLMDPIAPPTPVPRAPRNEAELTRVWYGNIGSGNSMMRNARRRDELRDEYNLIGLEMEAAGIMNTLPTGVVRGVCDYGDGAKNKDWQPYAAAVAAVYAKGILYTINPKVAQTQRVLLPSTSHVHWTVTRSTNTLFTGRDSILGELENIARDVGKDPSPRDQCRVVITGMGGQGKSEICLQLAYRVRYSFWGVFWVDVSTASLAESAFLNIASRLKVQAQTWEDGRQGLSNMRQPWLLVLDNADDPLTDYQCYFPAGSFGMVILTSRNEECKRYATQKYIPLGDLPDANARELLFSAAEVPFDQRQTLKDDAQVVASLLQSHPLALTLAGSYVSRGHCTLAKYPIIFKQQRQRLLTFPLSQAQSRYRDVYATFEASAESLSLSRTECAEDALQLLPVLATCGPSRLPLSLFEAGWKGAQSVSPREVSHDNLLRLTPWHVSHLPPLMQADANTWDSFRLIEAIHLLRSFSLVSTDTHSDFLSVSMHPLTHAWARDRQDMTEQHKSGVITGCLVAISRDDGDFWQQYRRQLQPHVQALTTWEISRMFASEPLLEITSILLNCGWLLDDMRDDAKLFDLMYNLFTYLSLDRCIVDRSWFEVYDLTTRNLVNYGKVKEATLLLEQLAKIRELTLAEDHADRLYSQHVLALAYRNNGQVGEAVKLLEHVVAVREKVLAEEHPSRLASQNVLAGAYLSNEQVDEAVKLLEHVVAVREKVLAEEHPSRLASQHELARAYLSDGQVGEAVKLLEHVVTVREKVLAEEHPDRLVSQHELAGAYLSDGQVDEAVKLLEHVVAVQDKVLAEVHPDRLVSQHELARAYGADGQVGKAVELLEHVVTVKAKVLRVDHPSRLVSEEVLAYYRAELEAENEAPSWTATTT